MSTGTLNSGTNWNESYTFSNSGTRSYVFLTKDSFADKNIQLDITVPSATPAFDGGALNNKGAQAVFTNMETSATNSSGIAILAQGSAGRDAVLYNGAVNGWVSAADNASASPAISSTLWNGTTYYATGVTLINGKSFNVTVPNGNQGTITFHFSVDNNGTRSSWRRSGSLTTTTGCSSRSARS